MKFNGLGPLGGQRKGENPEATSRRQTFPCSPAAEGAVGDQGAARCADRRICQKKTLGQSCHPPSCSLPQAPVSAPSILMGSSNSPPQKTKSSRGLEKRKNIYMFVGDFSSLLALFRPGPLPCS